MDISQQNTHTLYIMGNAYTVPAGFTIMTSMEYAGFQLTRGCGCRGAVCGACAVIYRVGIEKHWHVGLACQTLTQDHMNFLFLPHHQGKQPIYQAHTSPCTAEFIETLYPQLSQCIHCNTCTKSCPMNLKVLGYITALRQNDFEKVRKLSMECILCGICAMRCPREISPFAMALMARRLYTIKTLQHTKNFTQGLNQAQQNHWQPKISAFKNMNKQELINQYQLFQATKGAGVNE